MYARFSGEWKACSIFNSINYPLGYEIIGGETVKDSIEKDLGSKVCYNVRFQPYNGELEHEKKKSTFIFFNGLDVSVVSDRLENVKEIAKATMGKGAIADIGIEVNEKRQLVA